MIQAVGNFSEHGTPVRGVNWVKPVPGKNAEGKEVVYATMGQQAAPFFVLMIDLESGVCTRVSAELPGASYPTFAYWSERWQSLFVGAAYCGHLFQLRAATGVLEDCGAINEKGKAISPCRMAEAPDGTVYIGSAMSCDLTSYRPDTKAFTHHGRMDPDDMYVYPMTDRDGTLVALIKMTRPHVVIIDLQENTCHPIGPMPEAGTGSKNLNLQKGSDGYLYIAVEDDGELLKIEGGKTVPVPATEVANLSFELAHQPPLHLPPQPLADGGTVEFCDRAAFEYRRLKCTGANGTAREFDINWQGDGTSIFLVHAGPDGNIYGSSVLPERFFRFDPAAGTSVDFGQCSVSGGEAYAMANLDGKIYIVSYPDARLSVYDPEKPYSFGTEADCNPRDLGRMDDVACRSPGMLAGPAGKVWVASEPDYGLWGGTLAWYDPATGTFGSHRHLLPDCSPVSLAWGGEGCPLLVGMSVVAGTGAKPRAERVALVAWDPDADQELWHEDFGPHITHIKDLVACNAKNLYAVMHTKDKGTRLYLLDIAQRKIINSCPLPEQFHALPELPSAFLHGRHLYLPGEKSIVRTPVGQTELKVWWKETVTEEEQTSDGAWWQYRYKPISAPGAVLNNRYYYASSWRLRSIELPPAE